VSATRDDLFAATARGLLSVPRELPPVWLYDERGSRLYERILQLPEYYLPRREAEILQAHAADIAATGASTLVELGSGAARNTRLLLDALAPTLERFVPLDVSEEVLVASANRIALAYSELEVAPVFGNFEEDVHLLPDGPGRLIAFLGSTIGNLYPERRVAFLRQIDAPLLLSLDLVKDGARLVAAYDDPQGVTEQFARNALIAVDRELRANFHQCELKYEARWDAEHEWMDIGFRIRAADTLSIPALELELRLEEGEWLRVEISAKFRRESVQAELEEAGLRLDDWWTDRSGDFAVAKVVP
jgi:L-histidine N-alpha-methyltransferase